MPDQIKPIAESSQARARLLNRRRDFSGWLGRPAEEADNEAAPQAPIMPLPKTSLEDLLLLQHPLTASRYNESLHPYGMRRYSPREPKQVEDQRQYVFEFMVFRKTDNFFG